jgi:alpha-D-xyloside xylohydrolase
VILLVREGAVIPHIGLAQSTKFMDWSELELRVYAGERGEAGAWVCLPDDKTPSRVALKRENGSFQVSSNPYGNRIRFRVREAFQSK